MKIANYCVSDDACFKYRVLFPQQALAEKGLCQFRTYFSAQRDDSFAPDLVIFQKIFALPYLDLMREYQSRGIKTIFEVDDNYADLDRSNMCHLICSADRVTARKHQIAYRDNSIIQKAMPAYKSVLDYDVDTATNRAIDNFGNLLKFLHQADLVTVSAIALRKTYHGYGIRNIAVLPNLEKESEWRHVVRAPLLGRTVVGWAGSFSHFYTDLHPIAKPVIRAMNENPSVHLHLIGVPEAQELFAGAPKDRIFTQGWSAWEDYKTMIAEFDVNLAPSFGSVKFAKGKSAIRTQQAAMLGIPSIGSELTYGDFLRQSGGGCIAKNPNDWFEYLHNMCADSTHRREMGKKGKEYVWEHLTLGRNVQLWTSAYEGLIGGAK